MPNQEQKRSVRWDLIAASALLGACLIISAYLLAPPRYAAFALNGVGYTFVRVDRVSGELLRCEYSQGCQRVWIQPAPDEVDNIAANVANEINAN